MSARLLITGSRNLTDRAGVEAALRAAWADLGGGRDVTLIHGAAPGADALSGDIWGRVMGLPVEVHPADWHIHGRHAGPLRNQVMVDLGADGCLAMPESGSRGTWDCVRRAEVAGIPVRVVEF